MHHVTLTRTLRHAGLRLGIILAAFVLAAAAVGGSAVQVAQSLRPDSAQAQAAPAPGDCNGDSQVTTADVGAISQRIFAGLFGANQGCDANFDLKVDAGDLSCAKLLIANGRDACGVPEPEIVAPPIDMTVATDVGTSTQFLYTGYNPVQRDVAVSTINPAHVAVIRGRVLDRAGSPVVGVHVDVLSHPEFGYTLTRDDGWYDLAVNGGGRLVLRYNKSGLLASQRQVNVPWLDFAPIPDLVMIPADPNVVLVDLASSQPMQVVDGPLVQDSTGTRRENLLFPQGTTATMQLRTGGSRQLTQMHLRTTEFTVGDTGPAAMPADLPPNSGYTNAVGFTVDEFEADGVAVGGADVTFNQPILMYTDNYRHFKVGTPVPAGYYDSDRGLWVPAKSGLVIKVLSVTDGKADLDVDGSGTAASASALAALGFTDAERAALAARYTVGSGLWRVPTTHLSWWDWNWNTRPKSPGGTEPNPDPPTSPAVCGGNTTSGSIIECQAQVLGESVGIVGTPFDLVYRSNRQPGYDVAMNLKVPVTGATLPPAIRRVALQVNLAGRVFSWDYAPATNIVQEVEWDGRDVYGRPVQGRQPVTTIVSYAYESEYGFTSAFGYNGSPTIFLSADAPGGNFWVRKVWHGFTGIHTALEAGLGGWSLDVHHGYDRSQREVQYGNGSRRSADAGASDIIQTVAGNGGFGFGPDNPTTATDVALSDVTGLDVAPDGTIYLISRCRILKVAPGGVMSRLAGMNAAGFACGGSPPEGVVANTSQIAFVADVAVGPDGIVYFSDYQGGRIYKIAADGRLYVVAGLGTGPLGDNGPARLASLGQPWGLDFGPDGSLYVAEVAGHRVRRIDPDGVITTVAGTGIGDFTGDGGPATQARLNNPYGVDVTADGSIYIADRGNSRIRRVTPDGRIASIAGNGAQLFGGDGDIAANSYFAFPTDVAVAADGSVYIADTNNMRIRMITRDGYMTTVAGTGPEAYAGDNGPAILAKLRYPGGLAIGPDQSLYIADTNSKTIRRITPAFPGAGVGSLTVADPGGDEVFVFTATGRHESTLDGVTGAVRYTFQYDTHNLLTGVTDGDGNVTTIERTSSGASTAIVGPFGQRTELELNGDGYLAKVTNPAAEALRFTYQSGGMLRTMTDARGGVHTFTYDGDGRLVRDDNPAGGSKTLARTESGRSYTVSLGTKLDATRSYATQYQVTKNPAVPEERRVTGPDGLTTVSNLTGDTLRTDISPSGAQSSAQSGPDPRWGMLGAFTTNATVKMSPSLQMTMAASRSVVPAGNADPFNKTTHTQTTTVNGRTSTSVFNVANRQYTDTSAGGRVTTATVDSLRRPTTVQVAGLAPVAMTYDSRGRPISLTNGTGPTARALAFGYGPDGFLASATDALGRTVTLVRDAAGRVLEQRLPGNRTVAMTYDDNGNVLSVTPPGRPAHTFTYSAADEVTSYTPPSVNGHDDTTHYTYNLDHQLKRVDRPDGRSIDLTYDNAGRLATRTIGRGTSQFTYNATSGLLSSVSDPSGVGVAFGYTGDLLTSETWSGPIAKSVTYTYDNDFRTASSTVAGTATVTNQYDADGLLTAAGSLALTRSPQNGLLTSATLGTIADAWSYNTFAETSRHTVTQAGNALFDRQYVRDRLGRITEVTETIGGATDVLDYSYDAAGRLSQVTKNGTVTEAYTYDANGNRLTSINSAGTKTATYDAQDRLLTYGDAIYTYTDAGELASQTVGGQTTNYAYDELGNLISVIPATGDRIDYVVDGLGRRVGKKVNGALVQGFVYDGRLRIVAELDGAGAVVSRLVYATHINVPDYVVRGGVTYRVETDQVGSVRLVVNAVTGAVAQRMDYDAFGRVLVDTNAGWQPFGFAGGIFDGDSGLLRFGVRDYSADGGRWTAKDMMEFAGDDSNVMAYASSDPVNQVDPSGLDVDVMLIPANSTKNRRLIRNLSRVHDPDYFVVAVHSNAAGFQGYSAEELANIIRQAMEKSSNKKPIKLMACNAGGMTEEGKNAAEKIAILLYPSEIVASSSKVTVFPDGSVTATWSDPIVGSIGEKKVNHNKLKLPK